MKCLLIIASLFIFTGCVNSDSSLDDSVDNKVSTHGTPSVTAADSATADPGRNGVEVDTTQRNGPSSWMADPHTK